MKKYVDLLAYARQLGLVIKGRPKKAEVEAAILAAELQRDNDPEVLAAKAATLREKSRELEAEAAAAEEKAQAIIAAKAKVVAAEKGLFTAMVALRDAVATLIALGISYIYPGRLTGRIIEAVVKVLTPPVPPRRIYAFWLTGNYPVDRGYVAAESFEAAKENYAEGRVDFGTTWISASWCSSGREEVRMLLDEIAEGGEFVSERYSTTLHSSTLANHLYRFVLDGATYAGKAIVLADTFAEAKEKAIAGDIIEGDKPEMEPEDLAELQKALDALKENGRVERNEHVLTTETLV